MTANKCDCYVMIIKSYFFDQSRFILTLSWLVVSLGYGCNLLFYL